MERYKIKETEYQIVVDLYKQGLSQADISEKLNISNWIVRRIFEKYGISRKDKPERFIETEKTDIKELYIQGKTCQQIAELYGVSKCTISRLLRKNNVETREPSQYMRKYSVDEDFFDVIDTPEKAYVIGILWADGCNYPPRNVVRLGLQAGDKQILEDISRLINSDKPLQFVKGRDREQDTYALNIVNKHISKVLDSLGMHQAKSLILEFPQWLDVKLYPAFIRGYYDGDGGLSKREHTYNVQIVGTSNMCYAMMNILSNIGIASKVYNTAHNDVTKSLYIGCKDNVKNFLDWIYKDATIYLNRKYDLYISKYYSEENINNTLINVAS